MSNPRRGFTLVELLVVIGIIAVLIGILLPALNKARSMAQATKCLSNIRQWGIGYQMYANANKGALPEEGDDGDAANNTARIKWWDRESLWFNAIPPMVGAKSYNELQLADAAGTAPLPSFGDGSIFICPSVNGLSTVGSDAPLSADGRYHVTRGFLRNGTTEDRKTLFCYVPNSELNNQSIGGVPVFGYLTFTMPVAGTVSQNGMPRITQIQDASATVLMLEKRLSAAELEPETSAFYDDVSDQTNRLGSRTFSRTRADWQRFGGRHRVGGKRASTVLFADGHAELVATRDAVTPTLAAGSNAFGIPTGINANGSATAGDWNKPRMIWRLRGAAEK